MADRTAGIATAGVLVLAMVRNEALRLLRFLIHYRRSGRRIF